MTNFQLSNYLQVLDAMPHIKLTISQIDKIIELSEEMAERQKRYSKVRREIFKSYGFDKPSYQTSELMAHPLYHEMNNKVMELQDTEVELSNANFLTKKELDACCDKLPEAANNSGTKKILRELLLQKPTE